MYIFQRRINVFPIFREGFLRQIIIYFYELSARGIQASQGPQKP